MSDIETSRDAAVGRMVQAWMTRRGVTQATLAQVIGRTQTQVSARLRGRVSWSVDDLAKTADYFDIPIARLLEDVDPRTPAA